MHNAKVQRPSVCNAVETVLVHAGAADRAAAGRAGAGSRHPVSPSTPTTAPARCCPDAVPATEDDWSTEYMSLDIAVRVVDSLDEAIEHIRRYSTGHTESIITNDLVNAERFLNEWTPPP